MTIATEIQRIKDNIANTYTALEEKGATLPENQNSDNLADTVASVTTGGGGGEVRGNWTVPQTYSNLDKEMENDAYYKANEGIGTADFRQSIGFVLPSSVAGLWVSLANKNQVSPYAVRTSDGFTYSFADGTTKVEHIFDDTKSPDGYRWVIYYYNTTNSPSFWYESTTINGGIINPTYGTNGGYDEFPKFAKYLVINSNMNNPTGSDWWNLDSFKYINGHCAGGVSSWTSTRFWYTNGVYPNLKYYPSWKDLGMEGKQFNATSLPLERSDYLVPNLPYGVDLSSITSDITIGGTGVNYAFFAAYLHDFQMYVTLPAVNITLYQGSNFYLCCRLSRDNWKYLAEHAPTVSGKTISMGNWNKAICGGEDGEIITMFKNKGWTIA